MSADVKTNLKRLLACLGLGVVLALMIGDQEGNQTDFGFAFKAAVFHPRILIFLGIGVLLYLAMTFRPRVAPYLTRAGVRPLAAGTASVVASYGLLNWSDSGNLTNGKLSTLAHGARDTSGISVIGRLFFGSAVPGLYWILFVLAIALAAAAIIVQKSALAWGAAGLSVLAGVWGFVAHEMVRSYLHSPDHSTGAFVALLGYATIASASVTVARTSGSEAATGAFLDRIFGWKPGFPLFVIGTAAALLGTFWASWFSPTDKNTSVFGMSDLFHGYPINGLTSAYLGWLVWVLLVASVVVAGAATWLQHKLLGWASVLVGAVALLISLLSMHNFSRIAADQKFDGAVQAWQNIGTGAWTLCAAFTVLAGAGWMVARKPVDAAADPVSPRPIGSDSLVSPGKSFAFTQAMLVVVLAGALFYPPTATGFWQTVLVTEIGTYVLLAVGLNVVVGWAGLLDLGFIAFYAIGSYTTAYLTDTLPVKPPHWLHLSPLMAIPFAIAICLVAGVALGFPTLRLRGDYLAIVTLGFGEIIRIVAINAKSITNGAQGAFGIPQPVVHLGPLHLKWGQDPLQYWYLLLVFIIVVVMLFRRLENSRLGRAWAAVREDEVAAQATGVNTVRVKLLAFAIGASTSGLAGVFFASQIGYINPDNFVLNNSILVVAYVVFGGMGSLSGAIAGAAVLTWLPEFLKAQVPAEDRQMWIGAVILLMMIFRPAGLLPAKRRAAELSGLDKVYSAETAAVPAGEGM
ncbi:MAG: branched-chain amino acid transporter permease [Marmoricola sp.]|nr:branched-chain amino acid transporter permease [Marmoricola sp.]